MYSLSNSLVKVCLVSAEQSRMFPVSRRGHRSHCDSMRHVFAGGMVKTSYFAHTVRYFPKDRPAIPMRENEQTR